MSMKKCTRCGNEYNDIGCCPCAFTASDATQPPTKEELELRDRFAQTAMGALLGLISADDVKKRTPEEIRTMTVSGAYLIADAMMEERKKKTHE